MKRKEQPVKRNMKDDTTSNNSNEEMTNSKKAFVAVHIWKAKKDNNRSTADEQENDGTNE